MRACSRLSAADSICPEMNGITPMCRWAACPAATASISRARWSRSLIIAFARSSTTAPSAVGRMPRDERSNSGVPNMLSSSDSAFVTAGWLLAMCSATRVSDPCCWICSNSTRCRIFRRAPSRLTTSFASKVIDWSRIHHEKVMERY